MFEVLSDDDPEMSTVPVHTWNVDSGIKNGHSSANVDIATMNDASMNTFSDIAQPQISADLASWINLEPLLSNMNYPHTVPDTQHTSYGFENLAPDMMDFSTSTAAQDILTADLSSVRCMTEGVQRPSTAGSMDYGGSPEKVTLTIYKPHPETVECLIRIAMTNKSGFRLERS